MEHTTLAEEDALLPSLGVPIDVYATSVQGRPCRCLRFGSGPVLLLCVGGLHGNETTGREGVLQFAQELAANPPAVLDDYSVLLIPTANPDGVNVLDRMNANGVDLNRDFITLSQPETQGMGAMLAERPLVTLDLHLGGVNEDVALQTAAFPGTHPVVNARNNTVQAAIAAQLAGAGFTTEAWWGTTFENQLHIRTGLDNGVGIVAEIDTTPTFAERVALALEFCRAGLAAAQAQAADILADRATADATPITALNVRVATVDPAPAGYRILHIPAPHVASFGLGGVTALDRPVIGYVCDPAAQFSLKAQPLTSLDVPMRYSHTVTFTAGGVFGKPTGLVAVEVECKAGSGGGAGAQATGAGEHSGGGGGGGGEYRRGWLHAEELDTETVVTVGAGGAGGAAGGSHGGQSVFGPHITAKPGLAGNHLAATADPLGMTAGSEGGWGGTGGDLSIPGGGGGQYVGSPTVACGGIGGSSHLGGGGRSSTTTFHTPGRAYGGGGGGAANSENQPAKTGGNGAPGIVRVHVYVED